MYLRTIKYQDYSLYIDCYNHLCVKCNNIKDYKEWLSKNIKIQNCYNELKEIGESLYKCFNNNIVVNSTIDKLIYTSKNQIKLSEQYFEDFEDTFYIINNSQDTFEKILNNDCSTYINKFLIEYGIQNLNNNVYIDFKKLSSTKNDLKELEYLSNYKNANFELQPIINLSLSIYFIENFKDSLGTLISANKKSYSYKKLQNSLNPFPHLANYYEKHCIINYKTCESKNMNYNIPDEKFIIKSNSYIKNLLILLKHYFINIFIPVEEIIILNNNKVEIPKSINENKNLKLNDNKVVYHSVIYECYDILLNSFFNIIPKCDICGLNLVSSKYLCPKHLVEFGTKKLEKCKDNDKRLKIQNEIEMLKNNKNVKTPTIDSEYGKLLRNRRYDSKRK